MSAAPRLDQLTALRGIAAWLVVFYHARLLIAGWLPAPVTALIDHGNLAVDIFFILSGFVMWLNYGARLQTSGLAGAPAFWWRRFARIWPLHAAILTALAGYAALLWATGRVGTDYPWQDLPAHYLLVQNWGFIESLRWNDPAWSISAELGAYIVFPLAVLALPWKRLGPATLIALAVLLAAALQTIYTLAGETRLGGSISQLGLLRCVFQFAIGMVIANLWQRWHSGHPHERLALASGITGIGLMFIVFMFGAPQALLLPLGFAAVLLGFALTDGAITRALSARPLVQIGEYSYATYLVHMPLLTLWKLLFVAEDLQLGAASFAGFCAGLLLLSAGLYYLCEKPAQKWLNTHAPRRLRTAKA